MFSTTVDIGAGFGKHSTISLRLTESVSESNNLLDNFPPSLETLHLTEYNACLVSVLKSLEHLLQHKSSDHVSSLTKFILEGTDRYSRGSWMGKPVTAVENLTRVAAAHDVSVELIEMD